MGSEAKDNDGTDGRRVRRERNRAAVLDVVLDMFAEDLLMPSIEQVSKRSGLSLRSVYRYFADPDELLEAVISRQRERVVEYATIDNLGEGPFVERLHQFVHMRLRLHERVGSTYRATVHNAPRNARIRENLGHNRQLQRAQFERHFAAELDRFEPAERESRLMAADSLCQMDSIDCLRHDREFTFEEVEQSLRLGLTAILDQN